MSTTIGHESPPTGATAVAYGVLAGGVGGVALALVLYGWGSLANVSNLVGVEAGYAVDVALAVVGAAVAGAGFGAVATVDSELIREITVDGAGTAVLGAAYGIALWLVAVAIVVPLWFATLFGGGPDFPNLKWAEFVGMLFYGGLLGAVYRGLELTDAFDDLST